MDLTNTCSKYPHLLTSVSGFMASISPSIYRILHPSQLREQKITLNPVRAQVGIVDRNSAFNLELSTAAKGTEKN